MRSRPSPISHTGKPGLCRGGEGAETEAPLDGREVAKSVFGIVGGSHHGGK